MSRPPETGEAPPIDDYAAAWKALPRRERNELASAAVRGVRSRNRWDAAITLWWTQRELRRGGWPSLAFAGAVIIGLVVFSIVRTGQWPTSFGAFFETVPLLPVLILLPILTARSRKPKLRYSAQLNAAVLAGKKFDGPPDPEEAERLLVRARKEGWFRGTRPER